MTPAGERGSGSGGGWRAHGACRQADQDPEFWLEDGSRDRSGLRGATALLLCWHCPVLGACWADTLEAERGLPADMRIGTRAGMTPRERADTENGAPYPFWFAEGAPG